jgi:Sulfotransferase family
MALRCVRQPLILMGMARSGTTLLTNLLYRLGLFIGHERIVVDQEAKYFVAVNDMLLKRVHGYWDNPAPMRSFLRQEDIVVSTARCMEDDIRSPRIASFLGWKQYWAYRSVEAYDKPWGWKDPRNVFTLPLWLRLFPDAKIIYIVRNGVDVAESLLTLERRVIARRKARNERALRRFSLRSRLDRAGFKGAARCLELSGGFSLWEEYIAQAEELLPAIVNERRIVRYEDLLADPSSLLEELAGFCELQGVSRHKIGEAVASIDRSRTYAFLSDPRLKSFYQQVKSSPWMARHHYANLA